MRFCGSCKKQVDDNDQECPVCESTLYDRDPSKDVPQVINVKEMEIPAGKKTKPKATKAKKKGK